MSKLCPHIMVRIEAVIRLGSMMRCFLNVSYKAGVHTFGRLCRREKNKGKDKERGSRETARSFSLLQNV